MLARHNAVNNGQETRMEEELSKTCKEYKQHTPQFQDLVKDIQNHDAMAEADLRAAKEHLEKLKFNFIELETKRRFLQYLRDNKIVFDQGNKSNLEAKVTEGKAENRVYKDANNKLIQQLSSMSKDVGENYQTCSEAVEKISAVADDITQLNQELEDYQKSKPALLFVGNEEFTLNNANQVLENQVNDMIKAKEKDALCQSEIDDIKENVEIIKIENEKLRQEIQVNSGLIDKNIDSESVEDLVRLKEMHQWYEEVLSIYRMACGDNVQIEKDHIAINSFCINPLTMEKNSYEINLELFHDSKRIKSVMLIPELVNIDDIRERSIKCDSISFLVREIKQRIQKNLVIESELEILREMYDIQCIGGDFLTLKLDNGFQVDLSLEYPQEPKSHYTLKFVKLTSSCRKDQSDEQVLTNKLKLFVADCNSLEACVEGIVEMLE